MNLRLTNPLRGSREPWAMATRLVRFGLTALALLFLHLSARTLQVLVRKHARLTDPQGLPERPRRVAQWLCHLATGLLFAAMGLAWAGRGYAIGFFLLAVGVCAAAGWYLRRGARGLPNAFGPPPGRWREVLARLIRVVRDGYP